jgi:signal transduction histidine kinase
MALDVRLRISRQGCTEAALVLGGMSAFVAAVYATIVLPAHALWTRPSPPSLVLSVIATAIVAIGFSSVQARVQRWAARVVHADATSPYDVLRRFSETVGGGYPSAETLPRIAKALADGTHVEWAQVWLNVSDRLVLASTFPTTSPVVDTPPEPGDRADDASGEGLRALVVRHEGDALGVLRLQEREHTRLSRVEERLFRGLAAQAGLVLQTVKLEAELSARLRELFERSAELRASRERLIEAQDAERVKLERDIHDGAQQHLVALAINLQLAASLIDEEPTRAETVLDQQGAAAVRAKTVLTQLSRGIYPQLLVQEGLAGALSHVATSSGLPVVVSVDPFTRPEPEIEEALYFCCLEAVQNSAKHSGASQITIHVGPVERTGVHVTIEDNGAGFDGQGASAPPGRGFVNMHDRMDAIGGSILISSATTRGTRISLSVQPSGAPLAEALR